MRVETTPTVSGNRKSVRITTQTQFNGALVIMDSVHMPYGCGTWPYVYYSLCVGEMVELMTYLLGANSAFWTNGKKTPLVLTITVANNVNASYLNRT